MLIFLHRVGRNLNRAYRTAEAWGIDRIALHECDAKLSGALFEAQGRVAIESVATWPEESSALALETWCDTPLRSVEWSRVQTLIIGGETSGLPRSLVRRCGQSARIPSLGRVSGLTVEAALAVALYARAEALRLC